MKQHGIPILPLLMQDDQLAHLYRRGNGVQYRGQRVQWSSMAFPSSPSSCRMISLLTCTGEVIEYLQCRSGIKDYNEAAWYSHPLPPHAGDQLALTSTSKVIGNNIGVKEYNVAAWHSHPPLLLGCLLACMCIPSHTVQYSIGVKEYNIAAPRAGHISLSNPLFAHCSWANLVFRSEGAI